MLGYDYIKNHYRLPTLDLSRQKELHADEKAIQQIEFVKQLKNQDSINADGTQSVCFNGFTKKGNEVKMFSRIYNSPINKCKL